MQRATESADNIVRGKLVAGPVLVVDDDESYRAILRYYLEAAGYTVLEAADGAEAYGLLAKKTIPLTVLDIVMPKAEGLETMSRLRREGSSTKILAISGAALASGYLKMASILGADAEIEKGRPISELLDLVHSLLENTKRATRATSVVRHRGVA